jgi:cytosine/adenosine deaminase-related metal-dependent hydrolase
MPTCTPELLSGLGVLAKSHNVHVHSHISESLDEIDFVTSLHPDEGTDASILHTYYTNMPFTLQHWEEQKRWIWIQWLALFTLENI